MFISLESAGNSLFSGIFIFFIFAFGAEKSACLSADLWFQVSPWGHVFSSLNVCYSKVVCSTNFVAWFSRKRKPADFMAIIVIPVKPVICVVFWAWNINFFVLQGFSARNLAPAAHLFVVQFYFLYFWNLQTILYWMQFSVL